MECRQWRNLKQLVHRRCVLRLSVPTPVAECVSARAIKIAGAAANGR
jgi:hypothetical protein